jgi:hypothetical protein
MLDRKISKTDKISGILKFYFNPACISENEHSRLFKNTPLQKKNTLDCISQKLQLLKQGLLEGRLHLPQEIHFHRLNLFSFFFWPSE